MNENPSSEEIKIFFKETGLTSITVANLIKVDESTVRRWLMNENNKSYSKMPHSVWLLLNILYSEKGESIKKKIRLDTKVRYESHIIYSFECYIRYKTDMFLGGKQIREVLNEEIDKLKEKGIFSYQQWGKYLFEEEKEKKIIEKIKYRVPEKFRQTFDIREAKRKQEFCTGERKHINPNEPWNEGLDSSRLRWKMDYLKRWFYEAGNAFYESYDYYYRNNPEVFESNIDEEEYRK